MDPSTARGQYQQRADGWKVGRTWVRLDVGRMRPKSAKTISAFLEEKKKTKEKSILLRLWTSVISRMRSWNQSIKRTKAGSCSEVTLEDDSSGSYAVFTEQGSSASHMTAAKVMDVSARLRDGEGQEADAVSAYTQVRLEDAPKLQKKPKSECPDIWIRLPRHTWPTSWSKLWRSNGSS